MTIAKFRYEGEQIVSLEVSGHSGYQKKGFDIVCSGISTAVFTSIKLIDRLFSGHYQLVQKEDSGYLKMEILQLNEFNDSELTIIRAILENLKHILVEIQTDYPKYLTIKSENNNKN